MTQLELTADQLLSTTRAVRKRLDFDKEVPDELIRECGAAALQAPSGSNMISMNFVIVKDQAKRAAIADVYAQCWEIYASSPMFAGAIQRETPAHQAQQDRVADSATYLARSSSWAGHIVDHHPLDERTGGGRHRRYPLRHRTTGVPHALGLHQGHGVQAG